VATIGQAVCGTTILLPHRKSSMSLDGVPESSADTAVCADPASSELLVKAFGRVSEVVPRKLIAWLLLTQAHRMLP